MICPDCGKWVKDDKTAYRNHLYNECPLYMIAGEDIRNMEAEGWRQEQSQSQEQ